MPFTTLTPLELASLADRERVHTAMLAWVLGEHSPWPPTVRGRLAARLGGRELPEHVATTEAWTEWTHVDLLVRVDAPRAWHLAVEAKLKSSEHSEQLAAYDEALAKLPGPRDKVFLTLDGAPPRSGVGWQAVSYARLAALLSEAHAAAPTGNAYVTDLQGMVGRLAAAVGLVGAAGGAEVVFGESDADPAGHAGFCRYVNRLKLGKILQQAWMRRLAALAQPAPPAGWGQHVGETNGAALLNFQLVDAVPGYTVGLQLQHRALKMFCHPEPYPRAATAAQMAGAQQHLHAMMANGGFAGTLNNARTRGFTSLTIGEAPAGRDLDEWTGAVAQTLAAVVAAAP